MNKREQSDVEFEVVNAQKRPLTREEIRSVARFLVACYRRKKLQQIEQSSENPPETREPCDLDG
jgi:hypothetical protein